VEHLGHTIGYDEMRCIARVTSWMHGNNLTDFRSCMCRCTLYVCMDVCMDVWYCMDVWMDICMDVWMYGCMDVTGDEGGFLFLVDACQPSSLPDADSTYYSTCALHTQV